MNILAEAQILADMGRRRTAVLMEGMVGMETREGAIAGMEVMVVTMEDTAVVMARRKRRRTRRAATPCCTPRVV